MLLTMNTLLYSTEESRHSTYLDDKIFCQRDSLDRCRAAVVTSHYINFVLCSNFATCTDEDEWPSKYQDKRDVSIHDSVLRI